MASEVDFATEVREKQEELDETNRCLKEAGTALAEERRRLQDLQARCRGKQELAQKIANLTRSNAELRAELSRSNGQEANGVVAENVAVGEADKGLDFDGSLGAVEQMFPNGDENVDPDGPLTGEQRAFLASLERADVLGGRVKAYQQHNARLEGEAQQLKGMSHELEERYRRIVSICTGVDVDSVDEMLGHLVQAVVTEQKENMELGKVRDFLRLVQGSG